MGLIGERKSLAVLSIHAMFIGTPRTVAKRMVPLAIMRGTPRPDVGIRGVGMVERQVRAIVITRADVATTPVVVMVAMRIFAEQETPVNLALEV